MKLHLPLGLLVAVLAAFQTNAVELKEFVLSHTVQNAAWHRRSDGTYYLKLPFALYREMDWEFTVKLAGNRTAYEISSRPLNEARNDTANGGVASGDPHFYFGVLHPTGTDPVWAEGLGMIGRTDELFRSVYLTSGESGSAFSGFELNVKSNSGSVTGKLEGFSGTTSVGGGTGNSLPTRALYTSDPWYNPKYGIPPRILIDELYASSNSAASVSIDEVHLDLQESGQYVVARGGTLGAYSEGKTGLLTVWYDPRCWSDDDLLVLNGDEGRKVGGLFQNSEKKENVLRFVAQGKGTIRAEGESMKDFKDIKVKEGDVVYSDHGFYAKGIRVDKNATDYTLDINGEVGFAADANFIFAEDFTITGNGTVTWDGGATFDIAEGKTVSWDLGGSRDSETGDITAGKGHVTLGTKEWRPDDNNGKDVYVAGGTLSVGGDYALGTGEIEVYGSTLDMGGTVWANKVNLYNAEETASNLAGAGNAVEGTEVRITDYGKGEEDEEKEEESEPIEFNVGGLKGDYLKAVDLGNRGGRVSGIGGGTVTVGRHEGVNESFNFLVRQENLTYATGVDEPTGGTYMMEFSESGAVEFKDGKIVLTLDDGVAESLVKICEEQDGGYVDIWLTNGIMTELKEIQENGTVGDLKYWFQKWFDLEVGFEPGDYLYYSEEQKDDVAIEVPGVNDFVGGAEGGRGVLRFYLRVGGVHIWLASSHGDANAQDISNEQWKEVRVNKNMRVVYTKRDDGNIVMRNVSSGTGSGNLTIFNKIGDEDVTLNIDQQADAAVVSHELRGSLIMDQGSAKNRINLTKKGGADFSVTGNVENVGTLRVEEGLFTIGGDLVNAGTLSVAATKKAEAGGDATQDNDNSSGSNRLVLNGWKSAAETLGTIGQGSVLEVNGVLTLSKDAKPTGQEGAVGGKIGGKGAIVVNGTLDASEVVLDGVGIELGGENAGLVTSSQSMVENATGEAGTNKVSALSVTGEVEASLRLGGDLIIDSTGTYLQGEATYYRGSIKSTDGSAKTITVSGASTYQTLRSSGSDTVNLTVDGKAHLNLVGETSLDPETKKATPTSVVTYGNTTVKEGSTLMLFAPDAERDGSVVAQLQTENFTVEKGGTLGVYYNLKPTGGKMEGVDAAVVGSGTVAWGEGAKLVLGSVGINPFDLENPQDLKDMKVLSSAQGITGLKNGDELEHELDGSFRVFWKDVKVTYEDGNIVVNATARHGNIFAQDVGNGENVQAGAQLMWAARASQAMNTEGSEFWKVMNWVVTGLGDAKAKLEVEKTFAGVSGSTVPIAGTAQRDALRAQMLRMRDHAGAMGLDSDCSYDSLPYTHFWLEASGDFANLNDDDMMSGYKYNSWGGTVGLGMDLNEKTSLGLGLTALYGDLDGGSCDTADGTMDSYYLSIMARFARRRWGHTLVGVVGLNSVDLDRTVQYGAGSYTTSGSTDGWGAGLMYELTYDIPLNEEHTQVLQPLVGASVMRTTLDGYNENGQGVGLNVGEQEWVTSTFTLGLRWISAVGASVFNTAAQLELRANIAQDVGDSQGSADVALQVNPGVRQTVKAAEVGKTAAQLGAALRMPLSEDTLLYFNVGADLRSGMDSWSVTAGAKYNF